MGGCPHFGGNLASLGPGNHPLLLIRRLLLRSVMSHQVQGSGVGTEQTLRLCGASFLGVILNMAFSVLLLVSLSTQKNDLKRPQKTDPPDCKVNYSDMPRKTGACSFRVDHSFGWSTEGWRPRT